MKGITIKYIENHFNKKGYEPKHSFKRLKQACNELSKETNIKATDLLHLLIENRPIEGAYTHSYGFHTSNGRELIETLQSYYYNH
tara:strand:- start:679 stop:933 length:255 start_codon:yes stop_codon:yes gene_type:complete